MMAMLRLEVFEAGQTGTVITDTAAMEEASLAAYEKGYAAGWEDAAGAMAADQTRIGADLARNLQTLSFTYHESRLHVLRAVEPLLQAVVSQLLPEVAREVLAPLVLEQLAPLAEDLADTPISLVLNPATRPAVEALLEQATGLHLRIAEEPSLGEGQVFLRFGEVERRIDLDSAVTAISTAIRNFFGLIEKEHPDG